jgi:multisubunit Na+/H+ antiporter MnhC subunit
MTTAGTLMLVSLLMLAVPAHAYLDPSTGSMILSAIVGLFATLALAVKTYWYKLKSLFRHDDDKKSRSAEQRSAGSSGEPDRGSDRDSAID